MSAALSDLLIVGGGFAACSAMRYLSEHAPSGWTIDLLSGPVGPGVGLAYAGQDPCLRLNATHANMSLSVTARDEFTIWLQDRGLLDPDNRFAARLDYGTYLRECWSKSLQRAEARGLKIAVHDCYAHKIEAIDANAISIADHEGAIYQSRRAIICEGPLLNKLISSTNSRVISPIWPNGLAALGEASGQVVIIGTGLSAVDAATLALSNAEVSRVTMISRHGGIPHAHARVVRDTPPLLAHTEFRGSPKAVFAKVRALTALYPWQNVMDVLRRQSNPVWRSWSSESQAYFMNKLEPIWATHRNRVMAGVLEALDGARTGGRLEIVKAKFCGFAEDETGLVIETGEGQDNLSCDWLIDARGYQPITPNAHSLCGRALAAGYFRAATIGYGVACDLMHRATMDALAPVHVVGAARFGDLIETTGVPEIRAQVQTALETLIIRD
jgi:uncharacterized NAD(P)/FAD-binding protein YdhS